MMEFEDIQGLWQEQETSPLLDEGTLTAIQQFDKKVRRDKVILWTLLPLTTVFILVMAALFSEPLYVAGIFITIAAMAMFLIRFQRVKQPGTPLAPEGASKDFILQNLEGLKSYQRMSKRVTPLYGGMLILGQVVSMASFLQKKGFWEQVLYLGIYALVLAAFFYLVYAAFMRKWKLKWQPLMDSLEEQLTELEGESGENG